MEITNVLMTIAIIAVLVATINVIALTTTQTTGRASSDSGDVDVEIESAVNIRFNVANLDWGAGSVIGNPAILDTLTLPYADLNWSPTDGDNVTTTGLSGGLQLENWGNVQVSLNLSATQDVNQFICLNDITGTCQAQSPGFNLDISDNAGETGSCPVANRSGTWDAWTPVSTSTSNEVCNEFLSAAANNELLIDFQLVIPISAPVGARQVQIDAAAFDSSGP